MTKDPLPTSRCLPLLLVMALSGCSSAPKLMPTPNLYAWGKVDPFQDVLPELRSNKVDVLYYTDRAPEGTLPDDPRYGYQRSRSAAFGVSELTIGKDLSWEKLDQLSRTQKRDVEPTLSVTHTRELGRFRPTPEHLFQADDAMSSTRSGSDVAPPTTSSSASAEDLFRAELSARLAHSDKKDVYVFVHGFANSFDDSICTIGELWHFLGRQGVPLAYTWPAGSPGVFSYMYDRESSEFTVYHFKRMLRLIASCPEVRDVNIICHSRGTDVVAAGLRELCIELRDEGPNARERLKLGAVVMAAPDLDFDVVVQRMGTEPMVQLADQWAIYVCEDDKALGISNWLFSGQRRLGQMHSGMFSPDELAVLREGKHIEFIDVEVSDLGTFAHDYFYTNPAVSSDLILLMRYRQPPGGVTRRPLRTTGDGFWDIDDQYPGPPTTMNTSGP